MALKDEIEIAAVWTESNLFVEAGTGDVISDATRNRSGEEISDEYTLTVSGRSGGTGTVTVSTVSKNNPYDGRVVTLVNFDNATVYNNIVPGVDLEFDSDAVDSDDVIVKLGQYQGSFDASGVGAGTPGAGVRHRVTNMGSSEAIECKARLLTAAVLVVLDHDLFKIVYPFADGATEKTAGGGSDRVMPYKFEVIAVAGSGPSKTVEIEIDGSPVPTDYIQDITTGTLVDGTALKAIDPAYMYVFVDGPLEGLQFAIHEDAAVSDEANVLIFNSRFTQIASDTAGVAGAYGTSDVTLTQTGQAAGTILSGQVAYYWSRMLVPASANNESNPHPCSVALQASEAQDAGWEV